MILKNKLALLLSSLAILLPIPVGFFLADRFVLEMPMNLGVQIVLPTVSLLVGQWVCVWFTARDPGNQNRNKKVATLVLWIMPLISNLMCAILFALLLGVEFSVSGCMMATFGLLFAAIGNYMPKTRMNSTIGIKVVWAYSSEENWNATHRFAGKVWVIGGIALLFCFPLPEEAAILVMILGISAICILPVWYSWRFYKQELAQGKDVKAEFSTMDRRILKASVVFLVLLLIFVLSVMFVGDLEFSFGETALTIEADWYADATLPYDRIEAMEFRQGNVSGIRVGGFASGRLLMGFFQNEEFGTYSRYTYAQPDSCIVLTLRGQTWVLSGETQEETVLIYETLKENIN